MENVMDEESFIFWNDSKPSIHFNYVDQVTYKGVNVLQLRTDIQNNRPSKLLGCPTSNCGFFI